MTTVVDIPGVGEVEFPGGMSRAEIQTAAARLARQQQGDPLNLQPEMVPGVPQTRMSAVTRRDPAAAEALLRGAASQFSQNVANTPNLALTALMNIPTVRSMLPGRASGIRIPRIGDEVIPTPSGEQIVAGAETAAQIPGAALRGDEINLSRMFGRNLADADALARENPTAARIGGILGDGATLAAGRIPLARIATARPAANTLPVVFREPGVRRLLDRAVNSRASASFLRGVKRAGETGVEAAVLAALDGADPVQTGIYGATAQAAGSTALTFGNFVKKKPLASLAFAALTTAASLQVLKSASPGGADSVIDSIEGGFDKTVALAALAALAGAAGTGRARGTAISEDLPRAIEGGTALLRGSMISILKTAADEEARGVSTTSQTLQHLAASPGRFTEQQIKALERGFRDGTFTAVAQRLAESDEDFAQIIDGPIQVRLPKAEINDAVVSDAGDEPIIRAADTAKSVARVLGRDRVRRLGFDERKSSPKRFVRDAFAEADAAETMRRRLSEAQLQKALTLNLDQLLMSSLRRVDDARLLNGNRFMKAFEAQPKATKDLYSPEQRAAIESFAVQSDGRAFPGPMAARSLMKPGRLSKKLSGEPK